MPVTEADLRASKWAFAMHADMTRGGTINTWACLDFPSVKMVKTRKDRRSPEVRVFTYDVHEVDTLGDVAHLLNGEEDVVALKEDMRSVAKLMSSAAGTLNLMTESGKMIPAQLEAAYAAAEQALALMPVLRAKVEEYVAANKPTDKKEVA